MSPTNNDGHQPASAAAVGGGGGSASAVDMRTVESTLAMALQEYGAMQKSLFKGYRDALAATQGGPALTTQRRGELEELRGRYNIAQAAIESELKLIGAKTKVAESERPEYLERIKAQSFKLQCALDGAETKRSEADSLRGQLSSTEAEAASSLIMTESYNAWTMVMLFLAIASVGVTILAVFKPEYIKYAYIVVALCAIFALYHGIKYLLNGLRG